IERIAKVTRGWFLGCEVNLDNSHGGKKHLDKFLHVTQSIKVNGVTDDALRLYLFPHSLTHHATAWFDRLRRNSITTFEQMAKIFLGKYFPPSMVTKLRNEITNFRQRPDESLLEAWERYKLSIDRCPNHNMLPVTQIDTFYYGLTLRHRDTINIAGGTFMKRRLEECYDLIENMTAHHNDWDTSVQRSESSSFITSSSDPKIVALKAEMAEINKNLMKVLQINQQVKAVTHKCETCGGPHSYNDCPVTMNTASSSGFRTLPSNTITNPKEDLKGITTRSGNAYKGPTIPTTSSLPKVVEHETEVTKDMVPPTNNKSTKDVQPSVIQIKYQILSPLLLPLMSPLLLPFADMPKFVLTIKSLLTNKEKLFELAITPLNEHCSTVLLKKLSEKLGDPGKFLIPCDFTGMDECLALADLGASINLMPLSVWNKLSLPELSPTCMTLELADRLISRELTLRVGKEAVTFNLDQTSRYSPNYDAMSVNRIDLIDVACEEYSHEVLGFFESGNTTPSTEPIVSNSSPTLTPYGDSDFLLEETNAFLAIDDVPISLKIDESYYDSDGDILLLEEFLNDDPSSSPFPPQELKIVELKNEKSSIDEPSVVELKDLPPHLEYAFLKGDDKLPVIIAKDLKGEEKIALIKVLKSHKQALAWQISDVKGINPEFYTHKILMEDDFKPAVQHQRRVNLKIHEVIKKEVFKLLDARLIYPISDSPWVSPVYRVPKKGGFTVVENEENELIPTRLVTGWRVCIDYRKLNDVTHPQDQEKTTFTCPYGTFAYRRMPFGLCNAPGTFQRILKWCEDTNLCLNWEKSHFMVKEGIVLGHKISKNKVDKAKVDVIAKLPHPTTVKIQLNKSNELRDQAYENSLIYKEKTNRIHDSKIKDRVFNVGDRVLLFNSRLKIFSGKLKTRWSGPFTITQVFPYGIVKLSQTNRPNFKVNGHRLKHYFGEDIPKMVVLDLRTFPKDQ
nr:reverse transcriptase domain-containing protein [Tanacetum cinerariifolium]